MAGDVAKRPAAKNPLQGGGLFQVKKFLSGVASAVKEDLGIEAADQRQLQPPPSQHKGNSSKPPSPATPRHDPPKKETVKPLVEEKRTLLPPPKPSQVSPPSTPVVLIGTSSIKAQSHEENDWELLSSADDRASHGSSFTPSISGGIFVPRAGSVRSITSIDQEPSPHTTLSVPFKIQRTNSSSTLDSQDHAFIGPSGKGVLGVDYVEHVVLPTDTLQGICIAYKVSASQLRRANHFSGTLHSAPKKLLIPLSKQALRTGFIRVQDTDTKEYKLHSFLAEYPDFGAAEAKAYLELADWELRSALQSAKEDREWESGSDVEEREGDKHTSNHSDDGVDSKEKNRKRKTQRVISLKSGQIEIRVGFSSAGIPILKTFKGTGASKNTTMNDAESLEKKGKVKIHSRLPAIATKSVLAEDLVNAAPQHNAFGFELQELSRREDGSSSFSSSSSS